MEVDSRGEKLTVIEAGLSKAEQPTGRGFRTPTKYKE